MTKPLGLRLRWRLTGSARKRKDRNCLKEVPEDLIEAAVSEAIAGMISSNKPVAEAMQQVPVHAATDVTGFGLKGHAGNMAMLEKWI